jgi:hypothetical protein
MSMPFRWCLLVCVFGCGSSSNEPIDAGARAAAIDAAAIEARPITRSAGCDVSPTQALAQYVEHDEMVSNVAPAYLPTYMSRVYYVRLPQTYDPSRAYPAVFLGPGCGESGQSPIPLQNASKDDAILVGLNGIDNCFNHDAADTPELPYFDATLAAVEASFCVDPSRLFVAGFSSGGWLTSYLGCARGNVLRGQASVAGGLPPIPACTGPIAAMYVSDVSDVNNPTSQVMRGSRACWPSTGAAPRPRRTTSACRRRACSIRPACPAIQSCGV